MCARSSRTGSIIDEVGAPERRYKLVAHHGFEDKARNGLFGLFSPDGLRWDVTERPLLPGAGDRHGALKDPVTGEYVVFTRSPRFKARARGRDDPDSAPLPYKRIVGRTASRDFVNWSPFRTVLRNDDFDAPGTQFYSISPFRYGNRLLAFVDVYDTDVERMWVTLASSVDGIHWHRPLRGQPLLELGPEGRWDDTWVNVTNNPPVPEGDALRFWYVGRTTGHGLGTRTGALGSFLLTRDRFAGLTAGRATGTIVTAPVAGAGGRSHALRQRQPAQRPHARGGSRRAGRADRGPRHEPERAADRGSPRPRGALGRGRRPGAARRTHGAAALRDHLRHGIRVPLQRTLTTSLPKLAPASRPMNASGARSIPSTTSSR